MQIRVMEPQDIDAAVAVSAAAFGVDLTDPQAEQRWRSRIAFPLELDPEGMLVAERDGRIIGVAQALRRERLWCLSLLTVDPAVQSAGAGRALFDRALGYDAGTDAGLIVSSNDPRAMRLYGTSGFRLLPTLQTDGAADRTRLQRTDGAVREAGAAELEALAAISREVRGAPHTAELEFALRDGGRLLRHGDRGFVVVNELWGVWLLVARDDESAATLLWAAIGEVSESERPLVTWLTAEQQWAVDVLLAAGLRLSAYGAVCVRGDPGPLRPFIPSGPFA
ncbi:MAG TPA: GNAT family N-acetyltransferase [Solirubrobacteraceae bacterium]|nr:GNAT family N-acetyltransferase [Solirubrobacteraceae bacterium]